MPWLLMIRRAAWAAIAVLVFVTAAVALGWWRVDGPGRPDASPGAPIAGLPQIGGPFTLTDHRGRTVTERDLLGRPVLLFFGFTHCPDVCPTTLTEITAWLAKLGPAAERLQVLFVTADPERDTPELLALYLQSFDPRIVGLTGTPAQVEAALKAYGAVARKTPTQGGGYTVDHTASVYLMDEAGRFRGLIDYHEDEGMALAKLRRLLGLPAAAG